MPLCCLFAVSGITNDGCPAWLVYGSLITLFSGLDGFLYLGATVDRPLVRDYLSSWVLPLVNLSSFSGIPSPAAFEGRFAFYGVQIPSPISSPLTALSGLRVGRQGVRWVYEGSIPLAFASFRVRSANTPF